MIALLTSGVNAQISTWTGVNGQAFIANAVSTNINVGIGTNTPSAGLHIKTPRRCCGTPYLAPSIRIERNDMSGQEGILEMGIGSQAFTPQLSPGSVYLKLAPVASSSLRPDMGFSASGSSAQFILKNNGDICIGSNNAPTTIGGTDISTYKLFVQGGILTDEIRVRTGWADYVFNANYSLKPLAEVETFIANNHHLPNVPSASQVEEEGISLGEMAKIQQEKIEELMLYIIEQNKRIEALEAKVGTAK